MKKQILVLLSFFLISFAYSQDIIVKKDGSEIKARIIKFTKDSIYYKPFNNTNSKVLVMSKKNVLVVNKSEKEEDYFSDDEEIIATENAKEGVAEIHRKKLWWEVNLGLGYGGLIASTVGDTTGGNYEPSFYWVAGISLKYKFTKIFSIEAGIKYDKMPYLYRLGVARLEGNVFAMHIPINVNLTFGGNVKFLLKPGLAFGSVLGAKFNFCNPPYCSTVDNPVFASLIIAQHLRAGIVIPNANDGYFSLTGGMLVTTPYFAEYVEQGFVFTLNFGYEF